MRAAPYDVDLHAHVQAADVVPSYFARKGNLFNVLFAKRGWAWVSGAFALFVGSQALLGRAEDRLRAAVRWALVTGWWFLVTQWCFGPGIIDRGFRWTGGRCEAVMDQMDAELHEGGVGVDTAVSALACKTVGGKWRGGHDISGHVFILVLGMGFLAQEVGWVIGRVEERLVAGSGGEVVRTIEADSDEVKKSDGPGHSRAEGLSIGAKAALGVLGMSSWMLLMTAIYFHTWIEKVCACLHCLRFMIY